MHDPSDDSRGEQRPHHMDAADWDLRYSEPGLLWRAEPNRFLVEEVSGMSPGKALDLACGEGRNSVWLAGRGFEVTGVDFSAVALGKAAQLAAAAGVSARWIQADLARYRPESRSYDLVIVFYLHLPPPELDAVLRSATAALAEGGTLLFVGHDVENLTRGYGGPQQPEILHRPEAVVASLAGLEIEKATRIERPVDTDGQTFTAIDTLVRARRDSRPPSPG